MEETDAYVQIYRFLEVTADWYDEKPVKDRQRCDFRDIVIRRNELCLTVRLNQPAGSTIDCTRLHDTCSRNMSDLFLWKSILIVLRDLCVCRFAKGLSTFLEQKIRRPLRTLLRTRPYLFWSCCVPDVGLCMKDKFLMSYFDWRANIITNQIALLLPVRGRTEFGKMFGIDCKRYLFSPPLPLLAHLLPTSTQFFNSS